MLMLKVLTGGRTEYTLNARIRRNKSCLRLDFLFVTFDSFDDFQISSFWPSFFVSLIFVYGNTMSISVSGVSVEFPGFQQLQLQP